MSKFLFDQSNLIIVGSWNPAILRPEWLRENFPKLIKNNKYDLNYSGFPVPSVSFTMEGVLIEPGNRNLIFRPQEENEKLLNVISKLGIGVFEKLPHTPIFAVGHNFVYELEEAEELAIHSLSSNNETKTFYGSLIKESIVSQDIRHSFSFADYNLNIRHLVRESRKIISFNYHYPVNTQDKTTNAINQFYSNFQNSQELVVKLHNKEVA